MAVKTRFAAKSAETDAHQPISNCAMTAELRMRARKSLSQIHGCVQQVKIC